MAVFYQLPREPLVSCVINSIKNAVNGSNDVVSGLCPAKRLGRIVVVVEILSDSVFKRGYRAVGSAAQLVLRERGEESFDQIDPGTVGRREVTVKARMSQ